LWFRAGYIARIPIEDSSRRSNYSPNALKKNPLHLTITAVHRGSAEIPREGDEERHQKKQSDYAVSEMRNEWVDIVAAYLNHSG
jgi:hypothetical protein